MLRNPQPYGLTVQADPWLPWSTSSPISNTSSIYSVPLHGRHPVLSEAESRPCCLIRELPAFQSQLQRVQDRNAHAPILFVGSRQDRSWLGTEYGCLRRSPFRHSFGCSIVSIPRATRSLDTTSQRTYPYPYEALVSDQCGIGNLSDYPYIRRGGFSWSGLAPVKVPLGLTKGGGCDLQSSAHCSARPSERTNWPQHSLCLCHRFRTRIEHLDFWNRSSKASTKGPSAVCSQAQG